MTGVELGLLIIAGTFVLILLRVPIAVAMFIGGASGFAYAVGTAPLLNWMKSVAYSRLASFDLIVVPLFLLMGQFATYGGLSNLLFRFVNAFLGHFRGGLALATVGACAGFGAICGSSIATAATMAQVAYPQMSKFGYSGRLSTGSIAAGGTLGILIPPSVPLVVFAILTGESIGKLFVAAIGPAAIAFLGYLLAVRYHVLRDPKAGPAGPCANWRERLRATIAVIPVVLIFAAVVVSIYGGWSSPTEASAVGAVATFLLALAHGLNRKGFLLSLLGTAQSTAMIFLILIGADMLNSALAFTNMTNGITQWITQSGFAPLLVVAVIMLIYIALGCVMESMSMIVLTVPIFYPMIMQFDLWGMAPQDKSIWFGVMALMVVEIGLITPPVGLNAFVVNRIARNVPLADTFRGLVPFLTSDLARVAILFFFPQVALFLVHAL
ncbi:TRAP transporter large permease [Mesorhizobium sp. L-8-3]|uniref:TRAP transporter large permease n=1 Tax=Mesorhizobium sp. L-8-3 TaxID=2744522 RepID=UPI0019251C35|nr:TRAP transporter large permease [Mesorhizobium sp. L-8-3]BCH23426.1 C4-dicarboxylate ABC transporter permease [Mesorhizobium sp. L-8-3]